MKTGKKASEPVINRWIVRDLTLAAANGQLVPAFEREEVIAEVGEVLASGRHPILVGEAGVGKTAIIHGGRQFVSR